MLKKSNQSLLVVISLLLLLTLAAGCGSKSGTNNTNSSSSTPSTNEPQTNNLLEQIKAAGVIKVGVIGTYPPYNFLNENKEIDGFDADIAKEIAKSIGVKVEFAPQDFSGLIPSLQAKKIDIIISQVTITEERKQQLDFSEPYITNAVKIIVREDNNTITKLDDFKGKNIGIGLGTNDETYLRNEVLPKVGKFNIKTYDDVITSLQDLNAGRIDAYD